MTTLDIRQKISSQIKEMPDSKMMLLSVLYYVNEITKNPFQEQFDILYKLQDNWDGYGAPPISGLAITNCKNITQQLPMSVYDSIEILPTEYGGVQLKRKLNDGGIVSCDFGDETMSYYVEHPNMKPQFFSFIDYNDKNIRTLTNYLSA
jgi:hypothetical protein